MEIVIAAQGMPFGPDTLKHLSLGGSETAALSIAKELRKVGDNTVTIFCNLPAQNRPDFVPSGFICSEGVRWVSIDQYPVFVTSTDVDLLIVSRNPELFRVAHQAKKAALWCHDLATYKGFVPKLIETSFNFDEIWVVSQFHKDQFVKIAGYPEDSIKVVRNGIVKFDEILPVPIEPKTLLYSARPERGLIHLVKPNGIMSKLPDYILKVTMYDNYPEHMMDFYYHLWNLCNELPNVELLGAKTQLELRQLMASTEAYIYPTEFEEVSCILAREAIEQKLPFITRDVGALKETLGDCGVFVDDGELEIGSEEWCQNFADQVKSADQDKLKENMKKRIDLYWDGVAKQFMDLATPKKPSHFSIVHSLIQDSDVIPAVAYLENLPGEEWTPGLVKINNSLPRYYPFLFKQTSIKKHYEGIYKFEDSKDVRERRELVTIAGSPRYNAIAEEVAKLAPGSWVLEYGCAEGPIILGLAQHFPEINFYGIDFVADNISLCIAFTKEISLTNCTFRCADVDDWPDDMPVFQLGIVAEVLEHVVEPWKVLQEIESKVELGKRVIATTPQGPWEWNGLTNNAKQWAWRAHIWHVNKWMVRKLLEGKQHPSLASLFERIDKAGRAVGHLVFSYEVDHKPIPIIDPLEKAYNHRSRQTVAACILAMDNEDEILKCLNSIEPFMDQVFVSLGPCSDHTEKYITAWSKEHPWVDFNIKHVPKIEPNSYGFDDARNDSIKDVDADWIFWIDTDEYLSGEQLKFYLRNNAFQSYAIHQHHFTCDPRGTPAQLDKPARLFRNHIGYKFYGKIHEHAEIEYNKGPGFVLVLPSIDIGHTGYVNEIVRRKRFGRNFPMLEWDREVYPDRKLGKFLWLRDLIHRLKACQEVGDEEGARKLAKEAVDFYESEHGDFIGVGGGFGIIQGMAYCSEAKVCLGQGTPLEISIKFDDTNLLYSGVFDDPNKVFDIGVRAIKDEMEKRLSGYWV
jgi:glycosyltransferase involved in cell wall biosynthesis/2-polyprenyl-3-methyl-5-hydroxy-6-metoxy-1,4-benzoquinol methylase